MAIHDIGIGDNRRGARLTSHDILSERKADGTTSWSQKVNNTSEPRMEVRDAKIIAYDENGDARIFFGIVPEFSNEPVFAISKDGYDVLTAMGI